MSEFNHYNGCKFKDPDNCSGCALTTGGEEGPNYAAWPLSYIRHRKPIPRKWMMALIKELTSDNEAYVNNLKQKLIERGLETLF